MRTAEGCFTCHNTAAMTKGKLDPSHLIPSVTCEACHGPGAKHVSAEQSAAEGRGESNLQSPTTECGGISGLLRIVSPYLVGRDAD
jgi:hypothetical protein